MYLIRINGLRDCETYGYDCGKSGDLEHRRSSEVADESEVRRDSIRGEIKKK